MLCWIIGSASLGLLAGILIMAVAADRLHRDESDRLKREIHDNSVMYLQAVQKMEDQINDKERELQVKQRVLDALNYEVQRLRKINKRMKGD